MCRCLLQRSLTRCRCLADRILGSWIGLEQQECEPRAVLPPVWFTLRVGKTHLMLALGHHACMSGYSAYHISCREAIEKLLKAREQSRLRKALSWFRKPNVLLLDEVGHEPLSPEQAHVFFQLINVRYETGSIVMTSNRPFSKWAELMSDEAVATAMLDRLLHHVQVVSLKADSYRMKERLRVGAVGFD